MKTFVPKPSDITRSWYIVDAAGKSVGRIAAEVAKVLRGKNKPTFTPHLDTGDGVVIRADQGSAGFGKHIRIDHGFGYVTLYAHLSNYNVRRRQKVKRGDLIGFVGNTGRSQAPHLHYEVIKNGTHINPINFYYGNLSPEEFEAMQRAAQIEGQSLD